jgi:hypothetical protein
MWKQYVKNLCFELIFALDNYFLFDSAKFYVMNTYYRITTFGTEGEVYKQKFIFMFWSLQVLRIDFDVKNTTDYYKIV